MLQLLTITTSTARNSIARSRSILRMDQKNQVSLCRFSHRASLACPGNHGSPGWMHCFVSGIGTIGPRKMRHKSSNIVTSIAAPRASIATLGKSHRLPGFSSILQKKLLPECLTLTRKGKHLANSWVSYLTQHFL